MKTSESFLPDFCSLTTALVLVIVSLLLAFVLTLADFSPAYDFWSDLGLRAFFIIWIALLSGSLLCGLRPRLAGLGATGAGLATFFLVQCVTMLVTWVAQTYLWEFSFDRDGAGNTPTLVDDLRILAISGLVTAAWLRYQYVQSCWQLQNRAEVAARLDALQARMEPHFLFNTLNTIAGLVRDDPAIAEELLLDLSDVLRAILKKDRPLVPLSEEIELTRQYLHIEQQRLGERLRVLWHLEHIPQDAAIPPLSLQPLVENAIRHGVNPSLNGGRVEISGHLAQGTIVTLNIFNTLPETPATLAQPGVRQAVANLRARLAACFEDQATLTATVAGGYYEARIVMPYRPYRHESPDR
ncbi:sensor histidine kinase [Methylomagnum sp.]